MTLRIALVDDQEMYRLGFRMLLETQEEVEVVGEADDGRSALDLLARVKADVVLMDVRMPGMNGIEATRRIVGSGTDGPKVIVLTTFDLDEYAYEAIRAGASGFLLKDASLEELMAAIRHVHGGDAVMAPSTTRRLIEHFALPLSVVDDGDDRFRALEDLTAREREVLRPLPATCVSPRGRCGSMSAGSWASWGYGTGRRRSSWPTSRAWSHRAGTRAGRIGTCSGTGTWSRKHCVSTTSA